MKSLPILLKLARRNLDQLRRLMKDQQDKLSGVIERQNAHNQMVLAEQQAALRDYESLRAYTGFAGVALAGRQAIEGEIEAINQEIERLRSVITEAHVEVRKFERLLELHEEREQAAAERRADMELDEMAVLRGRRSTL